ncbi:hypothetical protein [Sphingobacterium faecale]|uniref:DUF4369 domain-containing protein n=1 Tax=Sphingobacterium faecale TaxID=2803775 RepID=A0ABS1R6H1_9SPHI|nr:hypothetical protein [Sphingobacterium faecale]MBL1410316.1 hypothetical protein [Sphingobacterium faecale]
MRVLQLLFILVFCHACGFKSVDTKKSREVVIQLTGLPVDSCSFRINHIITGQEIFVKKDVDLSKPIIIPALEDDMYIAVFSWPRTLVSHQVFKSKQFDRDEGVDMFQLTKPLYVNQEQGSSYRIDVAGEVELDQLERQGASILQFKNVDCSECDLADQYWKLFNEFFDRKALLVDSLKKVYYHHIDKNDLQKGNSAFLELEEMKNHLMKDDLLDEELKQLIATHVESKVSTFFLFYQLYNYREFDKFENAFQLLKNDARQSKYYEMVKKQYDAL